jgi:hypothetical protein
MPRRVRNPGSGKPPHNGPPGGRGYGPPKGAGTDSAKKNFEGAGAVVCPRADDGRFRLTPKGEAHQLAAEEALGVMYLAMTNEKWAADRLRAAMFVYESQVGKAKQSVDFSMRADPNSMTDEDLAAIAAGSSGPFATPETDKN